MGQIGHGLGIDSRPYPGERSNMDPRSILQPVCAQVLLTYVVLFWMMGMRYSAIKRAGRGMKPLANADEERAIYAGTENPSDNFENLFEMPVFFFVAMLVLFATGIADPLDLKLAWAYVAFRAVHTLIHCIYNNVDHRFIAYALSCLTLLAVWK
jgi:hypothetical protein